MSLLSMSSIDSEDDVSREELNVGASVIEEAFAGKKHIISNNNAPLFFSSQTLMHNKVLYVIHKR